LQNFRGQQLPSILTEDADEERETGSYPTHYHTVTGATPGIRQLLKPILMSRDDERGRHKSGDDVSKPHRSNLMDVFRPRSKSDTSRLKKPNFMSKMSSAVQVFHIVTFLFVIYLRNSSSRENKEMRLIK